ncbi:helix-turn-helix transcriptional regulator [Desulfatibacillum aliphaticivorans]|nr:WYL domain-containing protein [Desulfatibacillum aliphaticivorans]
MTELARMLDCSKPTVRRIVDDIFMSHSIRIDEEKVGKQLYFRIPKVKRYPILPLSTNEIAILEMCQAFTRHLLGDKQFGEATRAMQKNYGLLSDGELGTTGNEFGCISPGTIDYTSYQEILQNLITAISSKRVCRVTYQALYADKARSFHILPLKIFSHKDSIYVHTQRSNPQGEPNKKDDYFPLLSVHRFKSVEVLENTFELPKNYDFEAFFNKTFGVMKGETFLVKAQFFDLAATYVCERNWSANQKIEKQEDGSTILEFEASSEYEVIAWTLSFRENAKILEPDWLKEKVVKSLRDMLGNYQ